MSESKTPIPFTPLLRALPATVPFVGPETLEREQRDGRPFAARIGANESAFGVSPRAVEMMRAAATNSWYGDPENHQLREALAEKHGVGLDNVCVDAGIDSLLGLCVRMFAGPGTPVVSSLGAYPTFNYHVAGAGAERVAVPYRDDREDPEALLAAALRRGAPLVYLANPDNPMGTWQDADTVQGLIDRLPEGVVLALDEAYIDFCDDGHITEVAPPLDVADPRVIRLRTFSKAYGMAGFRVGYALAHPELITGFNKIRNHFAVSRLAQIGALAALSDHAFLQSVRERVAAGRERIHALAAELGLASLPSLTNFVAVDLGNTERASRLQRQLQQAGIFIRMPGVAPLNRCIRVGVGDETEQTLFAGTLRRLLAG